MLNDFLNVGLALLSIRFGNLVVSLFPNYCLVFLLLTVYLVTRYDWQCSFADFRALALIVFNRLPSTQASSWSVVV